MFYFPEDPTQNHKEVSDKFVSILRNLTKLVELKIVTSFLGIDPEILANLADHIRWNHKLASALISFKDATIRRKACNLACVTNDGLG